MLKLLPPHIALFLLALLIGCTTSHSQDEPVPARGLQTPPSFEFAALDVVPSGQPLVTHESNHHQITELKQRVRVGRPQMGEPFSVEIPREATPAALLLRIDGPVQGFKLQAATGEPRGDLQALATFLTQGLNHDYDKALRLFQYATTHFQNWLPAGDRLDTHGISPRNLADNFWVYGYGYCEDISYFCAALWQAAGLQARVVGIGHRHAQAEVFFDGNWRLFDAQHRSYWRDKADNILSASMLKTNPQFFYQGLDAFGLDPIAYPPVLLDKWYSENDLTYSSPENRTWQTDLSMNLRHGEYFELCYVSTPVHFRNPLWVQMLGKYPRNRRPPFGIAAKQFYDPNRVGKQPEYQIVGLNNGQKAYVFTMQTPYRFSDGWVRVPKLANDANVYIWTDDRFDFVGRPKLLGVDISNFITGTKRFAVCFVLDDAEDSEKSFEGFQIHTDLQMANVALPRLEPGLNLWPLTWEAGEPLLWLWYKQHTADLSVTLLRQEPQHPKVGDMTRIVYRITNSGSATSLPTPAVLSNPTTGLLMETVEKVGDYTIPPIEPGASIELETWWQANTRMHWYGQNPYVQTLDFRIDPDRKISDHNRQNHRTQHHIHLSKSSGKPASLPGYTKIGL